MKKSDVVRYVTGILFLLGGLGGAKAGDVLSGILTMLFGVSLLPIVYEKWIISSKKFHIWLPIIMFVLMFWFMPTSDIQDTEINNSQGTTVEEIDNQANDTEINSQKDVIATNNEEIQTNNLESNASASDIIKENNETINTTDIKNLDEVAQKTNEPTNNTNEIMPKADKKASNTKEVVQKTDEELNNVDVKVSENNKTDIKVDETPKTNDAVQKDSQEITINSKTVYITPKGEKYHLDPNCGGKNSYSTSLNSAENQGRTPCKKCAQ